MGALALRARIGAGRSAMSIAGAVHAALHMAEGEIEGQMQRHAETRDRVSE
jgi:hypothetical protein